MRKKRVWRYYCDFCGKAGCSGGHMKRHEASCTKNPDRVCGMCNSAGFNQKPIANLTKALDDGGKEGVERLREVAEGCPACMLAAINQSGLQYYEEDEDGFVAGHVDFDFAEEKKSFWDAVNEDKSIYQVLH